MTETTKPEAPTEAGGQVERVVIPRHSAYGFYCQDCRDFVYSGFDARDKIGLPRGNAVCVDCGEIYEDK